MHNLRDILERWQIIIYFGAVVMATVIALLVPGTTVLATGINWSLALMLFVTFLQVPLSEMMSAFTRVRFLAALLTINFVVVPLLVAVLTQLLPVDSMVRLGVLLVLLTPCIDYVVTFSNLGGADARLLLAATPALLIVQILLLPIYLGFFLGEAAVGLVKLGPFVQAFIWLIVAPLMLAALVQVWATRSKIGKHVSTVLGLLPVPATAFVLFIVIASVLPQIEPAISVALQVIPLYIAFAIFAPLLGWGVGRLFRLDVLASRAIAFSAATRNSLVVLPLAFVVPGSIPVLPAIIVTQTLVELVSELIYIRFISRLGGSALAKISSSVSIKKNR